MSTPERSLALSKGTIRRTIVSTLQTGSLVLVTVAALYGIAGSWGVAAAALSAATIDVRVWQDVGDERSIYVSARPAAGNWRTLGTIALPLDDGHASNGRYRYGDLRLDVPLRDRPSPATVEVRVGQDVANGSRIYVSARSAGGDWGRLGMIRLALDDGHSSSGRYRYGNLRLDVPLPPPIPDVKVEFTGDFSPEQRIRYEAEIRREFESVARFFAIRHDVTATGLTIRLTTDHSPAYGHPVIYLKQRRVEPTTIELEGGSQTTTSSEWAFLNPLAHEYVHALQAKVRRGRMVGGRSGFRGGWPGTWTLAMSRPVTCRPTSPMNGG